MTFIFAPIESAILIEVDGKDSERYLNNRLSNNIKQLTVGGAGSYSAALSVQGKTEGLFFVARKSLESYFLMADGGEVTTVLPALSRYKVADRVNFKDCSNIYQALHIYSQEIDIDALEKILVNDESIKQNYILHNKRNRFGYLGIDLILSKELLGLAGSSLHTSLQLNSSNCKKLEPSEQLLQRLKAAIPSFPVEISPELLLQESGLEGCYSITKGCYVGQEVIQKIASFANTPAKLFSFEVSGELDPSSTPTSEPSGSDKIGSVVSFAHDSIADISYGFMRIKSKLAQAPSEMRGYLGNNMITFHPVFDFTKI